MDRVILMLGGIAPSVGGSASPLAAAARRRRSPPPLAAAARRRRQSNMSVSVKNVSGNHS